MTQPEIMKLLQEAAAPECTAERRTQIGYDLQNAACPEGSPTSTFDVMMGNVRLNPNHHRGYEVQGLFRMLVATRPDLLPKQAAFFLYACRTDKKEKIDWSLIP